MKLSTHLLLDLLWCSRYWATILFVILPILYAPYPFTQKWRLY